VSAYVALLDGGEREEPITVRRIGPRLYEVKLRGKVHLVDAFRHDYGTLSLVVDHASYSAMLDWRDTAVNVRLRHAVVPLELLDERRLRLRRAAARKLTIEGKQAVAARVAGRIVKVLVQVGDTVRAGQPLVVVEALEMENELGSPKDGRVVAVHVRAGQAVLGNATLCEVE
jgi:biotin carboxyl carrier protein